MSDEQLERWLGDGDLDRVRQVGHLGSGPTRHADCEVWWADGTRPVHIMTTFMYSVQGGSGYTGILQNMRNMLGANDERVKSGRFVEVAPGAYADVERGWAHVFLQCDADMPLTTVIEARLELMPTESGEGLTGDEAVMLVEPLAQLAERVIECSGEVRGLSSADRERLMYEYLELEAERRERQEDESGR